MALGASGRCILAIAVVVIIIAAVVVVEGAAATLGSEVAPAVAAAALFLAVLLRGPGESEGIPSHRVIIVGGVDLLV